MHALVWHQSGGGPWAIAVQGEANPSVYPSMHDAIAEARELSGGNTVRVGLAGLPVLSSKVSASFLLPCRNVAMAASQIVKLASRCKTHPQLNADPVLCSVAVYRGSWKRPDVSFAVDVAAIVRKGDAPNFDMPRGTRPEIFDLARDHSAEVELPVVDITSTFAEQALGWSSALFPTKSKPSAVQSERTATAPPEAAEPGSSGSPSAFPLKSNPQDRDLFVRLIGTERP
ncbi:MAG: hypothetical protein AB7V13_12410 [Pseudorhodoplanes sp.]